MNLEKLRKQTKKNWKREMRSEYKRIMWKTKITINSAINNWCTVDIRPESHFAAWLVAKKLIPVYQADLNAILKILEKK